MKTSWITIEMELQLTPLMTLIRHQMYSYIHVCLYVCIYVYEYMSGVWRPIWTFFLCQDTCQTSRLLTKTLYAYMHVFMDVYMCACIYIHVYECMSVYMYVYMSDLWKPIWIHRGHTDTNQTSTHLSWQLYEIMTVIWTSFWKLTGYPVQTFIKCTDTYQDTCCTCHICIYLCIYVCMLMSECLLVYDYTLIHLR